jgi:hypothetical protein
MGDSYTQASERLEAEHATNVARLEREKLQQEALKRLLMLATVLIEKVNKTLTDSQR